MKKLVVVLALAGGTAAVAFAAFDSSNKKAKTEKKSEKKENKKQCRHTCLFG
jgi:hypothetical protein